MELRNGCEITAFAEHCRLAISGFAIKNPRNHCLFRVRLRALAVFCGVDCVLEIGNLALLSRIWRPTPTACKHTRTAICKQVPLRIYFISGLLAAMLLSTLSEKSSKSQSAPQVSFSLHQMQNNGFVKILFSEQLLE